MLPLTFVCLPIGDPIQCVDRPACHASPSSGHNGDVPAARWLRGRHTCPPRPLGLSYFGGRMAPQYDACSADCASWQGDRSAWANTPTRDADRRRTARVGYVGPAAHAHTPARLTGTDHLAAAEGYNNAQMVRRVGVDVDTVRLWRQRWRSAAPDRHSEATKASRTAITGIMPDLQNTLAGADIGGSRVGRGKRKVKYCNRFGLSGMTGVRHRQGRAPSGACRACLCLSALSVCHPPSAFPLLWKSTPQTYAMTQRTPVHGGVCPCAGSPHLAPAVPAYG